MLMTARRSFAFVLVAALWCAALSAQTVTVTRDVNLRSTHSTAHPPIRLLLPLEMLTLVDPDQTAGYYHVRTQQNETGWVWSKNVSVAAVTAGNVTPAPDPAGPPLPPPGSYISDNATCPAVGTHSVSGVATAYNDTTDAALRNRAKRHTPVGAQPVTLDLFAFHSLQDDVNSRFTDAHDHKTEFHPDRHALSNLPTNAGNLSEGDLVQLAGYLTAVRSQGPESVNCAGQDGTDIHLNVGTKNSTEWKGIVVEMIPQLGRPGGWDAATLGKISTLKLEVLVVGGLTYDNEHLVNDDAAHPNGTQPKRISLWEIHPITEFYVCEVSICDPANHDAWKTLTTWARMHGP